MCVIPSASSLTSWCSGQRPGAVPGGPLGTAADGGEQSDLIPCSTSPLPSWLLPAGCGAGQVSCCPWLSLHGTCWHLPWQDPSERSVPARIIVFIVLSKWLLGKARSGLDWLRHPVCVEPETVPNQEGEQNQGQMRRLSQIPSWASLAQVEQRDLLPCPGWDAGSRLLSLASQLQQQIPRQRRCSHTAPWKLPLSSSHPVPVTSSIWDPGQGRCAVVMDGHGADWEAGAGKQESLHPCSLARMFRQGCSVGGTGRRRRETTTLTLLWVMVLVSPGPSREKGSWSWQPPPQPLPPLPPHPSSHSSSHHHPPPLLALFRCLRTLPPPFSSPSSSSSPPSSSSRCPPSTGFLPISLGLEAAWGDTQARLTGARWEQAAAYTLPTLLRLQPLDPQP